MRKAHDPKLIRKCIIVIALLCASVIVMASCSAIEEVENGGEGKIKLTDYGYIPETSTAYVTVLNEGDRTAVNLPVEMTMVDADGNPVIYEGEELHSTAFIYYLKPGEKATFAHWIDPDTGTAGVKAEIMDETFLSSGSDDPSEDGITVSDVYFDGTEIRYTITNDSDNDYEYYQVNVNYYDKDGNLRGGEEFNQKGIPAHSEVERSWGIMITDGMDQYEYEVQVRICSEGDNNFFKEQEGQME